MLALRIALLACLTAALAPGAAGAATAPGQHPAGPTAAQLAADPGAFMGHAGSEVSLRRVRDSGRYRLTLHGVPRRSRFYDSHPLRVRSKLATGRALNALFGSGSRVGAIEVPGAPPGRDALAVTLSRPSYDPAAATLSYLAQPLAKAPGSGQTPRGRQVDAALPAELGAANVFVGSAHSGQYCQGQVFATPAVSSYWLEIASSSKWPTDVWSAEPALITSGPANGPFMEWQSDGEDGRGCSNSVTVNYGGPWGQLPAQPTLTMAMTYKIGNKASVECGSAPTGWANCATSTHKHGLFDTDLTVKYTLTE